MSATRCQCGGDMPGRCPGPAFCPMCDRRECEDCGTLNSVDDHSPAAAPRAIWLCDLCAAERCEDQAERAAEDAA